MTDILHLRDPRHDPREGDILTVENKQYTVSTVADGAVHFELLSGGHREKRFMPMSAWRERMKAATISKVTGAGVTR